MINLLSLNEIKILLALLYGDQRGKYIVDGLIEKGITFDRGSIYNALYRLQEVKLVRAYRNERKMFYSITDLGRKTLREVIVPIAEVWLNASTCQICNSREYPMVNAVACQICHSMMMDNKTA